MLQHNSTQASRQAHLTHAAVLTLHAFCCGLPALAMAAAALSGVASGTTLLPESFNLFHDFLHGHEIWILTLSAALVVGGGWFELTSRRGGHNHGFPWLFLFSAVCFLANVAIIAVHRG